MKRMKKVIIIISIIALYCIPIALICVLSTSEVKEYSEDIDFEFKEMAYGEIAAVTRVDMREYYSYDGSFVSDSEKIVELPYNATVHIDVDGEVFSDMVIATVNGNEIKAEVNGVVSSIDYGENITIKIKDISSLLFECQVPKDQIQYFEEDILYDESGDKIQMVKKSNIMNDGYIRVYLKLPAGEYYYGEKVQGFKIYTGNVFHNSLVVPCNCVYKKLGKSEYYVRQVTETGEFLNEAEVMAGYSDGEYICITGVEEGTYCDSGYKAVMDSEED